MTPSLRETQARIAEIKGYLEKHDVKPVAPMVKRAFDAWRLARTEDEQARSSELVQKLVGQCFSYGDKAAEKIGREYACHALQYPDDMPDRVEFALVVYVVCDVGHKHYKKDFVNDSDTRSEVARFCAHALARFGASFDPAWDPTPPIRERNKAFSGPDAARLTAEYDEETGLLYKRYSAQKYLHKFNDLYLPNIERNLAIFYSKPPAASTELEKCLLDHGVDEEITARILSAVRPIEK